jgi:uncharacterized protein (UPF0548 family)
MYRLRQPSNVSLQDLLKRARSGQPTYGEIEATMGTELPIGYRHTHQEQRIIHLDAFDRASEGLRHWKAHLGAGATVYPALPLRADETILVIVRLGPLSVVAPCRIVLVVDEPDRFGFAYGTLPGHPEIGEESFVVERDQEGSCTFTVRAFSRPGELLARLGGPLSRSVQDRMTGRYLDGLSNYALSPERDR